MSTFKLRRFNHPDALKAIDEQRLITFLLPYKGYLVRRAVDLNPNGRLDYERLVDALMNPDEDVPEKMVEALYFVHEMADPNVMETILSLARKRSIVLDLDDEPTAADVAVAMWLAAPDLLRELQAESSVGRSRSFEFYSGAEHRRRDFPEYDDELLAEIGRRLDGWFIDHLRGSDTKVRIYKHRNKHILLVRHGATMWRQGTIKRGKSGVAYFRPEVHDALVYDRSLDVLGLKTGMTQGESRLYRRVFGELLFGSPAYFNERFELSLDPLRERGPEVLNCDDVPGLSRVVLIEARRNLGGETKHRKTDQSTDLFRTFGSNWSRILNSGQLVSAKFEVTLGEGKSARTRKVTINPKNIAKYERDDDDTEIIEMWLKRRGLMPVPEEEDEHAAPIDTPLEDAGGIAGPGDRAAGVEAAS